MSLSARCSLLLILLLSTVVAQADGFAFGPALTPELQETNQLAVINLTPTTADVAMYIAIDGIPPGKTLTYVLPFWYQPLGFSMKEEDVAVFKKILVAPAQQRLYYQHDLALRTPPSRQFVNSACAAAAGLPGLWPASLIDQLQELSIPLNDYPGGPSGSAPAGEPPPLQPYSVKITPHARAELFNIKAHDLPQLILQSGLPAKYARPLEKYKTRFFAVMRLTGLPHSRPTSNRSISGVCYHFRHHLIGGQYTYPLGTGAAWPNIIPLSEIYITCPTHYALNVAAPVLGSSISWPFFEQEISYSGWAVNEINEQMSQLKKKKQTNESRNRILALQSLARPAPLTSSFLPNPVLPAHSNLRDPFAWQIAYANSNPTEDIRVTVQRRRFRWQIDVFEYFNVQKYRKTFAVALYLLAFCLCTLFLIWPWWRHAGRSSNFWVTGLITMVLIQSPILLLIIPLVTLTPLVRNIEHEWKNYQEIVRDEQRSYETELDTYEWVHHYKIDDNKSDPPPVPPVELKPILTNKYIASFIEQYCYWGWIVLVFAISGLCCWRMKDWRRWLIPACWATTAIIYALLLTVGYEIIRYLEAI